MVVGSGLLSVSIAFNAITDHGTCTAVFVVVAAVVTFLLGASAVLQTSCAKHRLTLILVPPPPTASIRTLGQISWLGWVGLISSACHARRRFLPSASKLT